jgi:hypothetical protein
MAIPKGSSALSELTARLMQLASRQPQHDRPELLQIMLLASQLAGQGGFDAPVYQLSRKLLREAMEASLGDELTPEQIERVTSTVMALLHLDESARNHRRDDTHQNGPLKGPLEAGLRERRLSRGSFDPGTRALGWIRCLTVGQPGAGSRCRFQRDDAGELEAGFRLNSDGTLAAARDQAIARAGDLVLTEKGEPSRRCAGFVEGHQHTS